jgi:N-methylhydantoinase A
MFADPPTPLVPRHLRLPVNERTRANGSILRPVDPVEIEQIAAQLRSEGVETVAICFLHSFSNPANERAAGEQLLRLLPGDAISLIRRATPDRASGSSTTVINAYVKPLTAGHLGLKRHR